MPTINTRTKDEIVVRILNSLEQNANITSTSPGSIARAFADAFGTEMYYLYESFREAVNQTSLSTASGRGLDLIGELYNVRRRVLSDELTYERSTANIEFFLTQPHTADIVIPKGTLVFNDVGSFNSVQYSYKVFQDVLILTGAKKAYGIVEPNFESNEFVASIGTLTRHNYIPPPGVILYCSNPKEIYPVRNAESDDNYRRRILSATRANAVGSIESMRFAALSVSGVRDIRVREASYGLGSCEIIVIPEVSGRIGSIPNAVQAAVANVRPIGVRLNVRVAEPVQYSVAATIMLPYGTGQTLRVGIERQAEVFVKRYLNSFTIGDQVSIQQIEAEIKKSSDFIKSVNITTVNADGYNVGRKDFKPTGEAEYIVAGNVRVSSGIIGLSNY